MNFCYCLWFILGILVGMKYYLLVLLICISLVANEHLFMCLWSFVYSFWKDVCSNPLSIFKFALFFLLLLVLCFRESFLSDIWYTIFPLSLWIAFHCVYAVLWSTIFFILVKSNLSVFFFFHLCVWCHHRRSWSFDSMYSPKRSFMGLAHIFKSVLHFELIL